MGNWWASETEKPALFTPPLVTSFALCFCGATCLVIKAAFLGLYAKCIKWSGSVDNEAAWVCPLRRKHLVQAEMPPDGTRVPWGNLVSHLLRPTLSPPGQNCVSEDPILLSLAMMGSNGHTRVLVFLNRVKYNFIFYNFWSKASYAFYNMESNV